MRKHFNSGNIFGVLTGEIKTETSKGGKTYISFEVNVSGRRCGSARAFCRMWGEERYAPFLAAFVRNPLTKFWLKGFFGQYWNENNEVFSNYTIFEWSERESDPRAAFILNGIVENVMPVKGGQRILLSVQREGQVEERFELINPDDLLLDQAKNGDLIEAKGYLRQEQPEDDFGGSSGPVRPFIEQLKILAE